MRLHPDLQSSYPDLFHFIPKGKSISRVLLSPTSTHPLSHTPKAGPEGFKMSPEKTFGAGLTTCGQNYRRKGGYILGIAINGPIRPCSFFLHLTPIFSLGFPWNEKAVKKA
jgi:hypothetical protein